MFPKFVETEKGSDYRCLSCVDWKYKEKVKILKQI